MAHGSYIGPEPDREAIGYALRAKLEGKSYAEIADDMETARHVVIQWCRDWRIDRAGRLRRVSVPPRDRGLVRRVLELRARGLSYAQVAAELGITHKRAKALGGRWAIGRGGRIVRRKPLPTVVQSGGAADIGPSGIPRIDWRAVDDLATALETEVADRLGVTEAAVRQAKARLGLPLEERQRTKRAHRPEERPASTSRDDAHDHPEGDPEGA